MFEVAGDSYGRFMGRWSEPLARELVALVGPRPGQRALDVGCGPGALTAPLVDVLGADAVVAVDPSTSFVRALHARLPDVDVREAAAEDLPFGAGEFDLCLAQLVVHFMADPVAGVREMARVTGPEGVVAASVWDHGGGKGPLSPFWAAVHDLWPAATGESGLPGSSRGQLTGIFEEAGLSGVEETAQSVRIRFSAFAEWWEPFMLGVGPAGSYVQKLAPDAREALRARCEERLPSAPFELSSSAWTATARPGAAR